MKLKWYALSILYCLFSNNLHADDTQQPIYQQEFQPVVRETLEDKLLAPIVFTTGGIQQFIEQTFNRQLYGQEILPNDFRHLLQFLHHGQKSASKAYAKSVLKLFSNKLKSATYVNAYAFIHMLKHIGPMLEEYTKPAPLLIFDQAKKQINDLLYNSFLAQFDLFKKDPDTFFTNISDSIVEQLRVAHEQDKQITQAHVQQAVVRFLDIGLSKLIWSPHEHELIWPSIKEIAQHLENLTEKDVIADADDLDDLYWTLVHRFSFFLDVANPDLPVCFYEKIKDDLATNQLLLCDLDEQEEHLESKGERLMQALLASEAKARLRAQT